MEAVLNNIRKCAVIVAHPDDETLWSGGLILMNPQIQWEIITLCRKSDADRNPKFHTALNIFNAAGAMGDADDGPQQERLAVFDIENTIVSLLNHGRYDLIITHNVHGEYTRHRRHEEVSEAVVNLIGNGRLITEKLFMFAYEDGGGSYCPMPMKNADVKILLPDNIWRKKYEILNSVYGFDSNSWEAKITPKEEAFWCFDSMYGLSGSIRERGKR
jgi:hypothetical protein